MERVFLGARDPWVAQHVVSWLVDDDVVLFVVCALESQHHALAHWLLHSSDAWPKPIDEVTCLHMAIAHSCGVAAAWLLARSTNKQHRPVKKRSSGKRTGANHIPAQFAFAESIRRQVLPSVGIYEAAKRGQLRAVQWLHSEGVCTYDLNTALQYAACDSHLEVVEWLLQQHRQPTSYPQPVEVWFPYDKRIGAICLSVGSLGFCCTAQGGLRTVQMEKDAKMSFPLIDTFAEKGDLATILEIAQQIPDPHEISNFCTSEASELAAKSGNLELLQWIWMNDGRRVNVPNVLLAAAQCGQLEIIKSLSLPKKNAVAMVKTAAYYGHLRLLQWLNGIASITVDEWQETLSCAIRGNHREIIRYIVECHDVDITSTVLRSTGWHGSVDTIQYILSKSQSSGASGNRTATSISTNTSANPLMMAAYTNDNVGAKLFCFQHFGVSWSAVSLDHTLTRDHGLAVAQWLYETARSQNGELLRLGYLRPALYVLRKPIDTVLWVLTTFPDAPRLGIEREDMNRLYLVYNNEYYGSHHGSDKFKYKSRCDDDLVPGHLFVLEDVRRWPRKTEAIDTFLKQCIRYRIDAVMDLSWVPVWAVRAQCFESLERLQNASHVHLFKPRTLRAVIKYTRSAQLMLWFLTRSWALYTREVPTWAAKYGLNTVLVYVVDKLEDEPAKQKLLVRSAAITAASYGHLETVELLWPLLTAYYGTTGSVAMLAVPAARHGSLAVLQWPHGKVPFDGHTIHRCAMEAAWKGQLHCLQWICEAYIPLLQVEALLKVLDRAVEYGQTHAARFLWRQLQQREERVMERVAERRLATVSAKFHALMNRVHAVQITSGRCHLK